MRGKFETGVAFEVRAKLVYTDGTSQLKNSKIIWKKETFDNMELNLPLEALDLPLDERIVRVRRGESDPALFARGGPKNFIAPTSRG